MLSVDFTFLFVLLNLIILYIAVKKLFFGRIGAILDKRADAARQEMQAGGESRARGEAYEKQRRDELAATGEECRRIAETSKRNADMASEQILEHARFDAAAILESAREQAERERSEAKRRLDEEAADLIIMAASKVIEANMDSARNRELVDEFIGSRGAA